MNPYILAPVLLLMLLIIKGVSSVWRPRLPFSRSQQQPEALQPETPATQAAAEAVAPAAAVVAAAETSGPKKKPVGSGGSTEKDWRDHIVSELVTLLMVTLTFMSFTAYFMGINGFLDFSVINDYLAKLGSVRLGLLHDLYFNQKNEFRHELWLITWSVILFVWLKFKTRKTDWNRAAGILKYLVLMGLAYVLINTVTDFSARDTIKGWFSPSQKVLLSAASPTGLPGNWSVIPGSRKILTGKGVDSNDCNLKLAQWGKDIKRGYKIVVTSPSDKAFYVSERYKWKKCFKVYERTIDFSTQGNNDWVLALAENGEKLQLDLLHYH